MVMFLFLFFHFPHQYRRFHLPLLWGIWSHSVYTQASLIINLTHAKLSTSGILSLFFVSYLTIPYRMRLGTFLDKCYKWLKLTRPPSLVHVCVHVSACIPHPPPPKSRMSSILMVLFSCHWMRWIFFYSYDYYFGNRYYFFKRKERKPNQIKYKPLGSIMALGFMSQSRSEPTFDRWKFVIPGYISFTEMLFESNFIKDARHWYNAALFCVTAFI